MKRPIHFFALCSFALLLSSCGQKAAKPEAAENTGKELFSAKNCVMCHGENGEGRSSAPSLHGLRQYYTKEQLVEYFRDPSAYSDKTPRLAERRGMYPRMMPSFRNAEQSELEQLADYVLSLE